MSLLLLSNVLFGRMKSTSELTAVENTFTFAFLMPFSYSFFLLAFNFPCPLREIRITVTAGATIPIATSVCSILVCPHNGMAASVWDLVTCAQMLMHEIAHGGDVPTPPESALELTLGEKSLAAPGTRTRVSIAAGFSVGRCTNGAIPAL